MKHKHILQQEFSKFPNWSAIPIRDSTRRFRRENERDPPHPRRPMWKPDRSQVLGSDLRRARRWPATLPSSSNVSMSTSTNSRCCEEGNWEQRLPTRWEDNWFCFWISICFIVVSDLIWDLCDVFDLGFVDAVIIVIHLVLISV